jgi:hypothetical protein
MGITSTFKWLGAQVQATVQSEIDRRLVRSGEEWLRASRALAPVRTGYLRSQEDFQVANNTLILILGASYDVFQEFGTRRMAPRPHVRPALNAIGRVWGGIEIDFNRPGGGVWQGILAHEGGFVTPSNLTHAQRQHVRHNLLPASQRLHRGNVRRAKVRVRRFGS